MHVRDSDDAGQSYTDEYGWDFPVLSDTNFSEIGQWGIAGTPATILVDEFGRVAGGFYGPAEPADWDDLVAQLDR